MQFFRNPEIVKTLLVYLLITILASFGSFMKDRDTGVMVFLLCFVFILVYLISTYRRYEKIAKLSDSINHILHEDTYICFEEYSEGELGVLQSEIRKMIVRLREQQQRLLHDKKYLADSLADISHQIKTPLTSINLLVSFLREKDLSEERRIQYVYELNTLLARVEWLITVLLKISKLDANTVTFKQETISCEQLIKKSVEPLLIPIELKEQELYTNTSGNFIGDVLWTSEAITNILKNCMEHTDAGGKLEIVASENPIYTEIIIRDNGEGIDKEELPHIFERFYKGKNSDNNSFGIGLALSRMIIASQNGTIKVENNKDVGTKFTIHFYKRTV